MSKARTPQVKGTDLKITAFEAFRISTICNRMPYSSDLGVKIFVQYMDFKKTLDEAIRDRSKYIQELMKGYGILKMKNNSWPYEGHAKADEITEKMMEINRKPVLVAPLRFIPAEEFMAMVKSARIEVERDGKKEWLQTISMDEAAFAGHFMILKP